MAGITGEPLSACHVAVPESREFEVFRGLLARRGARVYRFSMMTIVDAPDPVPVEAWLRAFIATPPGLLILMTGEGLKRLLGFVMRAGIDKEEFLAALQATRILARGPKPARVLRRLGISPELAPREATTAGVIERLESVELRGLSVGLQLYGDEPNSPLQDYLRGRGAVLQTVAPYRYSPQASAADLERLVEQLCNGQVDTIAFTSKTQVKRLFSVAEAGGLAGALRQGLARACVASVGPVVTDELAIHGCGVDVAPREKYFMKPLVQALCDHVEHSARTGKEALSGQGESHE